ncbi:hypothetical protein MRX96_021409 [Rhipicephalus microplus]
MEEDSKVASSQCEDFSKQVPLKVSSAGKSSKYGCRPFLPLNTYNLLVDEMTKHVHHSSRIFGGQAEVGPRKEKHSSGGACVPRGEQIGRLLHEAPNVQRLTEQPRKRRDTTASIHSWPSNHRKSPPSISSAPVGRFRQQTPLSEEKPFERCPEAADGLQHSPEPSLMVERPGCHYADDSAAGGVCEMQEEKRVVSGPLNGHCLG